MSAHSILIVDDTLYLPEVLTRQLRDRGYAVHSSHSVDEALVELRRSDPPTFILADRMLEEPIEVRNLARLCDAAPTSKVLVYTAQELTREQQNTIQSKGAYRVLDKSAVEQLIDDITFLIQEFDELLELSAQLQEATTERTRIVAALVGTGVAVSVVDRYFYRWFQSGSEGLGGGICRSRCLATVLPASRIPCRGCTVADVIETGERVDRILLQQRADGGLEWVAVQSTPIFSHSGDSIVAVREAVDRVGEATLAGLPLERRLQHVADALVAAGFGRARIYKAQSEDQLRLVAAAASTDGFDTAQRDYFNSVRDLTMRISECPYGARAYAARGGALTASWDLDTGPSPQAASLGLVPPYFDVPVWRAEGKLDAWISVDFVGLSEEVLGAAAHLLGRRESLSILGETYAREVMQAFEASGGRPADRHKFEVAERAKLGVAAATSVDAAITCIRDAFKALLPKCRVSVRSRRGDSLREFPSLCWGQPDADTPRGSPSIIALDDPRSLAASVVSRQRPLWISDYENYVSEAEIDGDPIGYAPEGTKSTAQIPLRFESTAFGALSINSPETIHWESDGFKGPLLALAENTALVLRDLTLHEERDRAMADLAAIVAYSVRAAGDALWRHWSQQRLAEASALLALARRMHATQSYDKVSEILSQASDVLTGIHASRPDRAPTSQCAVDSVFSRLRSVYAQREIVPTFEAAEVLKVNMPEHLLRGIVMVLVDNALSALQSSATGSMVNVTASAVGDACHVQVVDDGPGIPEALKARVLGAPVVSHTGQGVGLLYARGAALQYGGDLVLVPSRAGAHFLMTIPCA